ncbi:peptidase C14 [Pyrrhoderma noxium]|uniref:Peptidase C14 n=1 Tax=Pyrrhoderma noxium TaxID=2282107 RepID=A0A286UCA1_9AGAM|nr:peptidase C14 [Pyrrhoderma noxium]
MTLFSSIVTYTKDLDGDEVDGYDGVIYPVNYQDAGHIVDDDMHAIMVQPLPAGCRLTIIFDSYHSGSAIDRLINLCISLFNVATGNIKKAEELTRRTKTSPTDVISWAGCKDPQTSADTVEAGRATGAISYQTYQELLVNIRAILSEEYSQKPQLSSSHPMDTSIVFIF